MISQETGDDRLFRFKQFSLTDQGCGMKIGTDGVVLGSIAARYESRKTLDVGTGCGLIALMVAQKSSAQITALEIDKHAANTARLNIRNSPWASRIEILAQSFQIFSSETNQLFDLIVCNPPFFHNSQLTTSQKRNLARHSVSLSPCEILSGSARIIQKKGKLLLIIPFEQENFWKEMALEFELFCVMATRIFPNENVGPKRSVMEFSENKREMRTAKLIIEKNQRHTYTQQYIDLTMDYYLFM